MNNQDLEAQLKAIHNSTSWKITAPLRFFSRLFSGELAVKSIAKKIMISSARFAAKNPILLRIGTRLLIFSPQIRASLKRHVFFEQQALDKKREITLEPVQYIEKELSPKAKTILSDLRSAIKNLKEQSKNS